MGMRQEAIEKVKKDSFEHGSPQEVLQRLLLAWIEYDEGAAERILAGNCIRIPSTPRRGRKWRGCLTTTASKITQRMRSSRAA